MARVRVKALTFDLRELRVLAERIRDDADRYDPDLLAFAEFYSYDMMLAGLHLKCPTVRTERGRAVFLEATTPREIRERTLAWLEARHG